MQSVASIRNQRILGRRYPLNKSNSTWLEIGISIVPEPAVRIALINKRNQQIVFSEEAWQELQHKKEVIMTHPCDKNSNNSQTYEKLDDDISVYFGQVNNHDAVSFQKPEDGEVIILRETCENLYNMHHSVLNVIEYLNTKLDTVMLKLKLFKNIVKHSQGNDVRDSYKAIISDRKYNSRSIVDTELAALCIDGIVWSAIHQ